MSSAYTTASRHLGAETGPVGAQLYYDVRMPGMSAVTHQPLPTTGLPSEVYEAMYGAHDTCRGTKETTRTGCTAAVYRDIEGFTSTLEGLVDLSDPSNLPEGWSSKTARIRQDWRHNPQNATNTVSLVIPREKTVVTFANTHDDGREWLKPFPGGALERARQMLEFESDGGNIPGVHPFETYWANLPDPKEIAAVQVSSIAHEHPNALGRGIKAASEGTRKFFGKFSGRANAP